MHSQFHFDKLTSNAFLVVHMGIKLPWFFKLSSCSKAGVGNLRPAGHYATPSISSEPPPWYTSHALKWGWTGDGNRESLTVGIVSRPLWQITVNTVKHYCQFAVFFLFASKSPLRALSLDLPPGHPPCQLHATWPST